MLRLLFSVITVSACLSPINLPDFELAYEREASLDLNLDGVQTTGDMSTGEFAPADSSASYGTLTYGKTYTLTSITAKRSSENLVNGATTDVEMQFNFDNNLRMSVFCNNDDSASSGFWGDLKTAALIDWSLSSLPTFFSELDTTKYFEYDGSEQGCDGTYLYIAAICAVDPDFTSSLTYTMPPAYVNVTGLLEGEQGTEPTQAPDWGYPEDAMWGDVTVGGDELCLTGESQSPVDIPNTNEAYGYSDLMDEMNYNSAATTAVDDHGLTFSVGTGAWGNYGTDPLQKIALHTGSEHTLDGVQYDLEVQLVHENLIISVLCSASDSEEYESVFFSQLYTALIVDWNINPASLFTDQNLDTTMFIQYDGSKTQPPCTEGMEWYVLVDTCEVPQNFMSKMAEFDSMTDNFRAVQDWTPDFEGYSLCTIGTQQSPIDLPGLEMTARDDLKDEIVYAEASVMGAETDTGIVWTSQDGENLGTFKGKEVEKIQVITPSAHKIGGESYDAEFQITHADNLVLSILFNQDDELQTEGVFNALQTSTYVSWKVDLTDLLDLVNTVTYFDYMGSLTEDPCTEQVQYYVVGEIGSISGSFLDFLAGFDSQVGNNRAVQINSNGVNGVYTMAPTVTPTDAPTITFVTKEPYIIIDSDDGTSENEAIGFIFVVIGIIVAMLLLYVLFEYTISQQRREYQEVKKKKEQVQLKSLKTLSPEAYMKRFDSDMSRTL